jgi:hypothetical protein
MTSDYPLFEHWYQTLNWILSTIENFPKKARFSVASKISDEALKTIDLIIEAIYTKHRVMLLNAINLSLEKQRIFFRLSKDRQYISIKQYEFISKALNEAGKMVGGWKKSCETY